MNPKKAITGAEHARKFRAAHHTPADLRKQADKNKLQHAKSRLTLSKLAQAHERALSRARSQRFRGNENLKKINERRRKDGLPKLTLKLMREGTTGPSVPLATHSATTEESIVTRPSRRSSRFT